jgi:selenoprotein W-related protein
LAEPRVQIEYCTKCKFMLRAAWMATELLAAFEGELREVVLVPGSGGIFEVRLDGEVVASNRESKAMPEVSEVKRLVRDHVAPERRIGHD